MTRRELYGWVGEVALIGLTVVVAYGMQRLFTDTSYLRDVLVLAVASHLVAIAARRAGLGMLSSALLSMAAAVVTVTTLVYGDTANVVLPTRDTIELLRLDLSDAWEVFSEESAPVTVVPGFVVISGVAFWVSAFLADWAAFRLRSPLEAVAPATSVFVFTSLLGADHDRVLHSAMFTAGVAATLLAMRVIRQAHEEVWIEPARGSGPGATLRLGLIAGSLAVLAGATFGPLLPGAGDPGLVDVTELDNGPDTRTVVSPLVQVQATIVEQADFEIFSVKVDPGDNNYWRLMSLDEFNGDLWRASSDFDPARGPVPSNLDPSVATRDVVQTITPTRLGNIYLPVAYELAEVIDDGGIDLEYEVDSASLVITRDSYAASLDGFEYTIRSAVPQIDGERIRTVTTTGLDGGFLRQYTDLPVDFPQAVRDEAARLTAGATSDYDKALALQQYFQDNFVYNIAVALEHDITDMESFLFDVREGYCEQFASSFAAMARSVGLPTRLAVGFTWGDWSEARGEYVVRGEHAHAWPEVYFEGTGWIGFEPTPGRGSPALAAVTGVAPAQAGTITPASTTSLPATDAVTPLPFEDPAAGLPQPSDTTPVAGSGGGSDFPFVTVLIATLAIAAAVAVIPTLRLLQRRRRVARVAHDPDGRIELAWDDAVDSLDMIYIRHHPHETPLEFARRAQSRRRELRPMTTLAESATLSRYAAESDDEAVVRAERAASEVGEICRAETSRRQRARRLFDPRPLVKR